MYVGLDAVSGMDVDKDVSWWHRKGVMSCGCRKALLNTSRLPVKMACVELSCHCGVAVGANQVVEQVSRDIN